MTVTECAKRAGHWLTLARASRRRPSSARTASASLVFPQLTISNPMNWEIYSYSLLAHVVGFVVLMAGAIVKRALGSIS